MSFAFILIAAVLAFSAFRYRRRLRKVESDLGLSDHKLKIAEEKIDSQQDSLKDMEVKLLEHAEMAIRDHLTGLYDKGGFHLKATEEAARSLRYKHPFSIILIDLDKFKQINDRFGHRIGDEVLREVAMIFRWESRKDIDVLCRIGGDEFALIIPETGKRVASKLAERIRKAVQNHEFTEHNLRVTASLGISTCPPGCNLAECIDKADKAMMHVAKKSGRNQVAQATN